MAWPTLISDTAAAGASNLNSGCSATVEHSGATLLCQGANPKVGLCGANTTTPYAGDLSGLSAAGDRVIGINDTTAGKLNRGRIIAKKTTYLVGDGSTISLTYNSGATNWTLTGADATAYFSQYDMIQITSGGNSSVVYVGSVINSTTITLGMSGVDGAACPFVLPQQLTLSNYAHINGGTYSWKIGGRIYNSIWEQAVSNLVKSLWKDCGPGWIVKCNDATVSTNLSSTQISSAIPSVTTDTESLFTVEGKAEDTPTVVTFSGSVLAIIQLGSSGNTIFKHFEFVNSCTANTTFVNGNCWVAFHNCKWVDGSYSWKDFSYGSGDVMLSLSRCRTKLTGKFSASGKAIIVANCCDFETTGTDFTSTSTSNCIIAAFSTFKGPVGRATITGSANLYTNCAFRNTVILINGGTSGYGRNNTLLNNAFTFTNSFSGYCITTNTAANAINMAYNTMPSFGNSVDSNCLGLFDSETHPALAGLGIETKTITPDFTSFPTNCANTTLLSQGTPLKTTYGLDTRLPIGPYIPAGGGGALGCACPSGVIMLLKNKVNWVCYEAINITTNARVSNDVGNHTMRVGKLGSETTATNNGNATYHKAGTTAGTYYIRLEAAECNSADSLSITGESATTNVRINIINAGLVSEPSTHTPADVVSALSGATINGISFIDTTFAGLSGAAIDFRTINGGYIFTLNGASVAIIKANNLLTGSIPFIEFGEGVIWGTDVSGLFTPVAKEETLSSAQNAIIDAIPDTLGASAKEVWDYLDENATVPGSMGLRVKTNLDSKVSEAGADGGLTGSNSVAIETVDSNGDPVPSVIFTVVGAGTGRTDETGELSIGLADGTWEIAAAPTNGIIFPTATITVPGNTGCVLTGQSIAITPAPVGQVTMWTVSHDRNGDILPGVILQYRIMSSNGVKGAFEGTWGYSDPADETGLIEIYVPAGSTCEFRKTITDRPISVTAPSSGTAQIDELIWRA